MVTERFRECNEFPVELLGVIGLPATKEAGESHPLWNLSFRGIIMFEGDFISVTNLARNIINSEKYQEQLGMNALEIAKEIEIRPISAKWEDRKNAKRY